MADPKRRGRPTVGESGTSTSVNLRLDSCDYDRACRIARREEKPVSEVLRRTMRRGLQHEKDDHG